MHSDRRVAHKSFCGATGGREHYLVVTARGDGDFLEQLAEVEQAYRAGRAAMHLSEETAVFRRVFVSDAINQAPLVRKSALACETPDYPVAVSVVQQSPLPHAKVAMLAYHVEADIEKQRLSAHDLMITKNGRRHLWTTGLCAGESRAGPSVFGQTRLVFGDLIVTLGREGASLRDNCLRTWLFLKDVDIFYRGMADGRGEIFSEQGLSAATHFIASTGIEGACAHAYDLVMLDAYSLLDCDPKQLSYLNDFTRLCSTASYNIHFERGVRVDFADRAQLWISGTASIDRHGDVVHAGDVLRQLDRALENVQALLHSGDAELGDLAHLIVYLRDGADYARVQAHLCEHLPDTPALVVQAPVCRPQWLVEIEGVALKAQAAADLPAF